MNISIISTNKNPLRQTYIKHITNMLVPASILAMESRFSPSGSPPGKMYLLTNALVKHVKQLMTHHDVHMTYLLFTSVHHSCHRKLWRKISCISPPARWGLLDFMSVACSSSSPHLLSSSSCSTTTIHAQCSLPDLNHDHHRQCSLPDLNHDHPRPVFPAGPQPRPSPPSVPCRTSTTTIHAQCSLPDLNREYPRQVFPAGPQPRVSTPSVPCRTSCRKNARRYAR